MGFMVLLALINLRGVGESVKFNVVLTLVEIAALTIVIGVGFCAIAQGDGDISRITVFESPEDKGLFLAVTAATSVAFFAMVGFEDSVNMVEETKEPERIFPRTMLTGLGIAVIIYMLVAVSVVAVLTPSELRRDQRGRGPGTARGGQQGRAGLPDRQGLPVPRLLRGRQHRPDQHADGQPAALRPGQPGRAAAALGKVSPNSRAPYAGIVFSTVLALGLIWYVANQAESDIVAQPGQHDRAAAARRVHRRQHRLPGAARATAARASSGRPARRRRSRRAACVFLIGPWVDRDVIVYQIAGGLLRHRRRAVGAHLAHQPRHPRQEDRLPRHRPHGGRRPLTPVAGTRRVPARRRAARPVARTLDR